NVLDCNGNPTYQGEIFNGRLSQTRGVSGNYPNGMCGFPIGTNGALPTNIFPAGSISPTAAAVAALFPTPNANINGNNYVVDPKNQLTQNNFDVRVDQKFSDRDNFFARFSYEDQPTLVPGPFPNQLDGGGFASGDQDNAYRSVALSEIHTFSPT